jgi:hypothetical protein
MRTATIGKDSKAKKSGIPISSLKQSCKREHVGVKTT